MTKRIVIMAGGTGGHVFPALAVAETLIENGWQVSWLGTHKGLESRVIPERGIEIDWLAVAGVRGKGLLSKVSAVGKLMQACVQAARILRQRKPDVVLGMGGFVAGPGGAMAKLMGIPLVIHEQNRIPGTTNRLLASHATRVLEAFPDSFKPSVKATCTGNPLRKAFLTTKAKKQREDAHIKLLIIGGALGLKAFAVAIIGGLSSGMGIIVGGLILGIVETATGFYISTGYKDVPGLILLLLVLAYKPSGLFGKSAIKKV